MNSYNVATCKYSKTIQNHYIAMVSLCRYIYTAMGVKTLPC